MFLVDRSKFGVPVPAKLPPSLQHANLKALRSGGSAPAASLGAPGGSQWVVSPAEKAESDRTFVNLVGSPMGLMPGALTCNDRL